MLREPRREFTKAEQWRSLFIGLLLLVVAGLVFAWANTHGAHFDVTHGCAWADQHGAAERFLYAC